MLKVNRVTLSALCAVGLSFAVSSNVQAQGVVKNSIYALAGGSGWNYYIVDNTDITGDGVVDSEFLFYGSSLGLYRGPVTRRTYNATAQTVRLEGSIARSNTLKFWATYRPGGRYNQGLTAFLVYEDTNNNGVYDVGERSVLNGTREFALQSSIVSFAHNGR